ncbi:drug resistance transporter, EmrB/QacA subfamily [Trujillonella endophytica]|uniref:Drug resistance transporter, EmrB/QacA subfamily n=1 Tax=Trujillonella endophytica TaxID=673521 RepID=A0A1H8VY51_9ACTN|nr:drug resistance transporter, EmrB/QacA subfamily [Trujillella endophytica]
MLSLVMLLVSMTLSSMNVALPSVQEDLGLSEDSLQWVVTSYSLPFGGLLLLGGRAGDLLGRRRVLLAGVALFTGASLATALATGPAFLFAARAVQGVGAALAAPSALALITEQYAEGSPRNRALGVYAGAASAGAAVGLVLGGALTVLSWRATALLNVPFGVLVCLLAPRLVAETARQGRRLDLTGAVTGTLGLSALAFALSQASRYGWTDRQTWVPAVAAVVPLAGFGVREVLAREPLLPLRLFRDRSRAGAYATTLLVVAYQGVSFLFLAQYVQRVLGYSPLEAGLIYLPATLANTFLPVVWARLMTRFGGRALVVAGVTCSAIGLAGPAQLDTDTQYLTGLLPFMVFTAAGAGLTFLPLTLVAVHGVESRDVGISSGVLNALQSVGGALGIAAVVSLAAAVTTGELGGAPAAGAELAAALVAGYRTAFWICCGLAVWALLVALPTIGPVGRRPREADVPGAVVDPALVPPPSGRQPS